MLSWYVAKSKPQKESLLVTSLAKWDVETFFPQITKPNTRGQKAEALFPTYVFCRMDVADASWTAVRWAPGVSYFLRAGDEVLSVPDSMIEYIRDHTTRWNSFNLGPRYNNGERVHIVGGPFAGLEAVFQSYAPSRQRCKLLLQTINGLLSVEIPEEHIRGQAAYGISTL